MKPSARPIPNVTMCWYGMKSLPPDLRIIWLPDRSTVLAGVVAGLNFGPEDAPPARRLVLKKYRATSARVDDVPAPVNVVVTGPPMVVCGFGLSAIVSGVPVPVVGDDEPLFTAACRPIGGLLAMLVEVQALLLAGGVLVHPPVPLALQPAPALQYSYVMVVAPFSTCVGVGLLSTKVLVWFHTRFWRMRT